MKGFEDQIDEREKSSVSIETPLPICIKGLVNIGLMLLSSYSSTDVLVSRRIHLHLSPTVSFVAATIQDLKILWAQRAYIEEDHGEKGPRPDRSHPLCYWMTRTAPRYLKINCIVRKEGVRNRQKVHRKGVERMQINKHCALLSLSSTIVEF